MNPQPTSYLVYLLRLWREQRHDRTVWRASLESAQSGQRVGFGSLRDLITFLETQAVAELTVADQRKEAVSRCGESTTEESDSSGGRAM